MKILDARVDFKEDIDSVLRKFEDFLCSESNHYVCTTNPEFIVAATKDPEFREIINSSDLSVPDGVGVLLARDYVLELERFRQRGIPSSAFQNLLIGLRVGLHVFNHKKIDSRITGVDMVHIVAHFAEKRGYNMFLLGGWPKDCFGRMRKTDRDLATESAEQLQKRYPNLQIVGATSHFSPNVSRDSETLSFIHKCMKDHGVTHIDFFLVAYGHGSQEKWIVRNSKKIPAKISIGVGGTLDYISEEVPRAPRVVRKAGFEWLYRLILQPWRLKRTFTAFLIFPYLVYMNSIKRLV